MFEPILKSAKKAGQTNVKQLTFQYKGKFKAFGVISNEGFVLLKGSQINPNLSSSARNFTVKARERYASKIGIECTTLEDILFSSPSAAAGFVGGCSLSGNAMWVTDDGKSPKDF